MIARARDLEREREKRTWPIWHKIVIKRNRSEFYMMMNKGHYIHYKYIPPEVYNIYKYIPQGVLVYI